MNKILPSVSGVTKLFGITAFLLPSLLVLLTPSKSKMASQENNTTAWYSIQAENSPAEMESLLCMFDLQCQDAPVEIDMNTLMVDEAAIIAAIVDGVNSELCGGTATANPTSFDCSQLGGQSVTITYTGPNVPVDGSESCTQTITINDTDGNCTCDADVDPVNDVVVCNDSTVAEIAFSTNFPGTQFNWVNDNVNINLGANGTGNITSFTAENNGATPDTANITVTPRNVTDGCDGDPISFRIIVNPTPQ